MPYRFLGSWQNTKLIPCTELLHENKTSNHCMLQNSCWFHTNDDLVHLPDQSFTYLPDVIAIF